MQYFYLEIKSLIQLPVKQHKFKKNTGELYNGVIRNKNTCHNNKIITHIHKTKPSNKII